VATVVVCRSCRPADGPPDAPSLGARLAADARRAAVGSGVVVREAGCLGNCRRGMSAVVLRPGAWSYVFGWLTPASGADLVAGARMLAASDNGFMPFRERPEALKRGLVARVPNFDTLEDLPVTTELARIPCTVVTGFLGAGKTTLIRHLLANAGGRRIALIINEFGDLGVDGEILKACGDATCSADDVIELSNGCICCTVADDFVPALERLLGRPDLDHIVIETSGLALPQPLVRAFAWPGIATRVTVDGVITVVDGKALAEGRFAHDEGAVASAREADASLDHETPLSELFDDQLACADMVVLNKTDLLSEAEAAELTARLRAEVRPAVQIVKTAMGALPVNVLLGQNAAAETEDRRAPHHDSEGEDHDHDEIESFVVSRPPLSDVPAFARRLAEVIRSHDILRLKGFAAVEGKPMRLAIQAVGPRVDTYYDRRLAAEDGWETRLVVIGEAGLDRAAIEAALVA
jgi:cobalamin biosynthesis protein CobW